MIIQAWEFGNIFLEMNEVSLMLQGEKNNWKISDNDKI